MMRDKRVKRKMSFFLRFVDETTAVFWSRLMDCWTKNGPKWTKNDDDREERERFRWIILPTEQTRALVHTHTHTDNADRGRAQKPGRLSNVPDMPRDLQSAV
jgi:hypothetical protein